MRDVLKLHLVRFLRRDVGKQPDELLDLPILVTQRAHRQPCRELFAGIPPTPDLTLPLAFGT